MSGVLTAGHKAVFTVRFSFVPKVGIVPKWSGICGHKCQCGYFVGLVGLWGMFLFLLFYIRLEVRQ